MSGRKRQRTNNLRDERSWGRIPSGEKGQCIIAPIQRYIAVVGVFKKAIIYAPILFNFIRCC